MNKIIKSYYILKNNCKRLKSKIDQLLKYIDQLEQENAKLRKENKELLNDYAVLYCKLHYENDNKQIDYGYNYNNDYLDSKNDYPYSSSEDEYY